MRQPNRLVILGAIAATLTACAPNPPNTATSPTVAPVTPPPAPTPTEVNINSLGVDNASAIKFVTLVPGNSSPNGFFDTVNASDSLEHAISRTGVVQLTGWAVIASKQAPADQVIITQGAENNIVAIAPVNVARADLLQLSPNYSNAGWNAAVDATQLSGDSIVLKAWAYDASQKTAFQLNQEHTLNLSSDATGAPSPTPETTPAADDQP